MHQQEISWHQSFETPAPPIRALAGDWGGGAFTSDTLHADSPVSGEFTGSHGLCISYRGNKRDSHSLVSSFHFTPDSNFDTLSSFALCQVDRGFPSENAL